MVKARLKQIPIDGFKLLLMGMVFALLVSGLVMAQDFTQGYSSDEQLVRGAVVGLNAENSTKVETITSERDDDMLGVAVRSTDSALTLTGDRSGVFVATSGQFDVLITDVNGDILVGDWVTISSIRGIGMKSDGQASHVLGRALTASNLGDPNNVLDNASVTDADGTEIEVAIGRILVDIDVQENPDATNSGRAPEFLINLSNEIAGKPVSAMRIYAGIAIIMVASTISGSLLYSAVKSSIISIGRNPLSKRSVLAGLAQVVIISVIIFMSGLFAVYLILKI